MTIKRKVAAKKVAQKVKPKEEVPKPKEVPVPKASPPAAVMFAAAKREPVTRRPVEWRKRQGMDAWHWIPQCSNWPTENFRARTEKPTTGERCNECKSKEARRGDS